MYTSFTTVAGPYKNSPTIEPLLDDVDSGTGPQYRLTEIREKFESIPNTSAHRVGQNLEAEQKHNMMRKCAPVMQRSSVWRMQIIFASLLLLLLLPRTVLGQEDINPDNKILCPFFNTLQPDTSSSIGFLSDTVGEGGVGLAFAQPLIFGSVVVQQGVLAALFGGVLDLGTLDELPGISHLDLYNLQMEVVTADVMAAADAEGFVTLQDLVTIKQRVAELQQVEEINIFSRGETIFVFLGAGGDLDSDKVSAANVLAFLASELPVESIGAVNTFNMIRGFLRADFS